MGFSVPKNCRTIIILEFFGTILFVLVKYHILLNNVTYGNICEIKIIIKSYAFIVLLNYFMLLQIDIFCDLLFVQ